MRKNEFITTNIATELLELKSKSWTRNILNKMTKEGILIAEGTNKSRKYILNKDLR